MLDRRAFRTSHPTRTRTRLAAVLLCAGLGTTVVPQQALADPTSDSSQVGSLANDLADAEKQLDDLRGQEGSYRQEANKSLDELNQATDDANSAQAKVVEARARLDQSQKDVDEAQDKLNEISRSQYVQGQDSNVIAMAAGEDATADTLDRASYLRQQADKQRRVVAELDRVRTKNANEESTLRKLLADASAKRDSAKDSRDKALSAISEASQKIQQLQSSIAEAQKRHDEIQRQLDALKGASSGSAGQATQQPPTTAPSSASSAPSEKPSSESSSASSDSQASDAPSTSETQQNQSEPTEAAQSGDNAGSAQDAKPAENNQDSSSAPADGDQHGVDYTAADKTQEERQQAAEDAKQKANTALAAANDAQEKEKAGSSDAAAAKQNAAQLAETAAQAVKKVEDLTATLSSTTGATPGDQALIGLTSAGLSALAAGLQATTTGADPLAAAQSAGQATARQAYDQIQQEQQSQTAAATGTQASTDDTTTSQLVSGLQNNADALGRVTDGTDAASVATTIGGAAGANASTDNSQTATTGSAETRIEAVIARAQSQLGVRYSWGGGNFYGPTVGIRDGGVADSYGDYANVGFDCSGLVLYAFYIAGFKLPHYTGSQYQSGPHVPTSQMKRGDLLFWGPNASEHVAIYLGNGQMIEAPYSGASVRIAPVRYSGMTPNVVRLIS